MPRDVVDDAVAEAGKGAKRARGKLPPHVMVYFVMALALFADDDYEEVAARLTETLRGLGLLGGGLGGTDPGRDHPGAPKARPRAHGEGVRAGRRAGREPGHHRGVLRDLAADVGGWDGVGRPGHGGKPGGVRVAGRLRRPGRVSEGAGGDGQRVRLACRDAGRDRPGRGREGLRGASLARKLLRRDGAPSSGLGLKLGVHLLEPVLGVSEEDQPEHRAAVLRGRQRRIRAQLIGGGPKGAAHARQLVSFHTPPHA